VAPQCPVIEAMTLTGSRRAAARPSRGSSTAGQHGIKQTEEWGAARPSRGSSTAGSKGSNKQKNGEQLVHHGGVVLRGSKGSNKQKNGEGRTAQSSGDRAESEATCAIHSALQCSSGGSRLLPLGEIPAISRGHRGACPEPQPASKGRTCAPLGCGNRVTFPPFLHPPSVWSRAVLPFARG